MLMDLLDTETLALFRDINTEYHRVRNDHVAPVAQPITQAAKSTAEAAKFRHEGNMAFLDKENLYEAVELYSKSVAMAPIESVELILAYINRAEVLFKLRKYVLCLLDVNRALMSGKYPPHLEQKLRDRKSQCMAQIRLMEESNKISGDEVNPVDEDDSTFRSWDSTFNNTLLPHTVGKIELKYIEESEKFIMVATEDIEPGEILSSEELSAFGVFPRGRYCQCGHCLKECSAMIPCPSCSTVLYCSEQCRTGAYNSYHRVECKLILSYYENEWYDIHLISIRAFLVGTKQGEMLEELMRTLSVKQILTEGLMADTLKKPFTNDYRTYLRVSVPFIRGSLKSTIPRAVRAVLMLKSVGFFQNGGLQVEQEDLDPAELYAGALLINHYCLLYRQYPQYYLTCDGTCGHQLHGGFKSMAYFVLHSLINYSCIPNTDAFLRKGKHTLFSIRLIKKDEYITFRYCFCLPFGFMPKSERTSIMSEHNVSCHCEPCVKDWPANEQLFKLPMQYQPEARSRWPVVMGATKVLIDSIIKEENPSHKLEVIQKFSKVISLLYENIKLPSYYIEFYQDCMNLYMKGLYDEADRLHFLSICNEMDRSGLLKRMELETENKIGYGHVSLMSLLVQNYTKISEYLMKCLENRCEDI